MKKVWLATAASFFFSGLGYIVLGQKRLIGLAWTVAALGLTYVEFGIQTLSPVHYWIMFASVFLLNTAFAVDTYQTGKAALGEGVESGVPAAA